jgi:DNA-binding protein Alba
MASNDKYTLVEQSKPETNNENEIRITSDGRTSKYIAYAIAQFKDNKKEELVLKSMGKAISKSVQVAELVKRRVPGIHQDVVIESVDIKEKWIPKEEGLEVRETSRQVSSMTIRLSLKPLDTTSIGYQKPLPPEEVQERPQGFRRNNNNNRRFGGNDDDGGNYNNNRRFGGGGNYNNNRRFRGGGNRRYGGRGGNRSYGGNRYENDDGGNRSYGGNRYENDDGGNRSYGGNRYENDDGGNRSYGGNRFESGDGGNRSYGGGNRNYGGGNRRGRSNDYYY